MRVCRAAHGLAHAWDRAASWPVLAARASDSRNGRGIDRHLFGPARPDGFAVACALNPEGIAFCITGWRPDLGAFCADLAALLPRVARLATAALRGC